MYTYMCRDVIYIYAYIHIYIQRWYVHIYTYTCTDVMYTYRCKHTCIHTHPEMLHACIDTYIHTHIHIQKCCKSGIQIDKVMDRRRSPWVDRQTDR